MANILPLNQDYVCGHKEKDKMENQKINGTSFAQMLMGGAAELAAHTEELNSLNVFPVADGDTGTNMCRTIEGGLCEIAEEDEANISHLSSIFAKGVLLSARGNSGVILSQIFAGINEGLSGLETVGAEDLVAAYERGIEKSYAAVQNPTEGTILTVFRESTEYAAKNLKKDSTVEDFFKLHIEQARRSLAKTKEILPALAEADVVDSGAAGYVCIAQGMYETLTGKPVTHHVTPAQEKAKINIDSFTRDSVLEFGYCTEFLLRLTTAKVDPDSFEISTVLSVLEELGGESVVAYQQGDIVKVHVHTFRPGDVLSRMQTFGEFLTVKIENMSLGHTSEPKPVVKPKKKLSVVSVATGDGLCALFQEMGAEQIVSGGQTSNPSIEEFIKAFDACEGENIVVLPNNKNVILAANQAAELYERAKVYVVPTKSLMQGYSALAVITPGITDPNVIVTSASNAAKNMQGCEITRAVRDVTLSGKDIREGDYIAISEGEVVAVAESAEAALEAMLETADTDLCEIITLFVGKDVDAERRAELTERLEEQYPDCEITVYEGGQEVYDYLVAIE
jgi:DAK2 domain fusion protein YloV